MSWISGLANGMIKLKTYIMKFAKYGSVAMGLLIPLSLILNAFGFVRQETIILITELIIYVGFGEIIIKIGFKMYRGEKAENAKLNIAIKVENLEALDKYTKEQKALADEIADKTLKLITSKKEDSNQELNIPKFPEKLETK